MLYHFIICVILMSWNFFLSLVYFDMDSLPRLRFGLGDVFCPSLGPQNWIIWRFILFSFHVCFLLWKSLWVSLQRGLLSNMSLLRNWSLFLGRGHRVESLNLWWSWSQGERSLLLHVLGLDWGQLLNLRLLIKVVLRLTLSQILVRLFCLQCLLHLLLL